MIQEAGGPHCAAAAAGLPRGGVSELVAAVQWAAVILTVYCVVAVTTTVSSTAPTLCGTRRR